MVKWVFPICFVKHTMKKTKIDIVKSYQSLFY